MRRSVGILIGVFALVALVLWIGGGDGPDPEREPPPAPPETAASRRAAPDRAAPSLDTLRLRIEPDELPGLRRRIAEDEQDLQARWDILVALFLDESEEARAERRDLILWFVRNHPTDPILGMPFGQLDTRDGEAYATGIALWDALIAHEDAPPSILANAAEWKTQSDRDEAFELYDRLQELESDRSRWHRAEAQLHMQGLDPHDGLDPIDAAHASAALQSHRQALEREAAEDRFHVLGDAIEAAALAGDWEQAEAWARELLSSAPADTMGDHARFSGHQGLGLALLHAGDLEGAVAELLQLSDTPPGPVQLSFGPPMLLAVELLERGETAAVLRYLDVVEGYWEPETVQQWRAVIEAGGTPEFGGNLRY